jgi:ABC-type multidrug transport system permease subunit
MASRARTIEGVSGWLNAVQVPMWLLSGVFFSSANFPDAVQPVIGVLPLTALVNALRAVALDGAGMSGVWREIVLLGAWGLAAFAAALRWFRWR